MIQDDSGSTVAFSSGGKYDALWSRDGTVRVWMYRPEELIADVCSRVSHNLTRLEWRHYFGDALPYQAVCTILSIEPDPTLTPAP